MTAISERIQRQLAEASWIRRMFEEGRQLRAERGAENVFDLALGNPIVEPPEAFRAALRELAASPVPGQHRYMSNAGLPEAREAVSTTLAAETGLPFEPRHIVMTVGAGGGLAITLKAILDPGDEVVLIRPFFPEYPFYVESHDGQTVIADSGPGFGLDLDALAAAIGPKTRAVLINAPNNPTGCIYPPEQLDALGALLEARSAAAGRPIYLIADEPYRKLVYDGATVPWVFHHYAASVLVTSHSKDLALPGERIGYAAIGPGVPDAQALLDAMAFSMRALGFVNAPALMQRLICRLQGVRVPLDGYQALRDRLCAGLTELGFTFETPQGAFYLFPESPEPDDVAFVRALQAEGVLVVPGTGFGMPGYFRISYAVEPHVVEGALAGIARVAERYGLRGAV